ncbi:MAG: hypothetical protein MUQ26_00665, partial [Armatimonadetes bacterium]|nr:hypothetical protein [Armatimonadota bacterium]
MSERGQTPTGGPPSSGRQPLPGRQQPLPGRGASGVGAPGGRPVPDWQAASAVGNLWRTATSAQRIGLGAFALICIGLIALAASIARHPQYAVLYANLEQEDAAGVVQHLRDLKTPYRVTAA